MRLKRRGSESMRSKLRAQRSAVVARGGDRVSAARRMPRSSARPMKTARHAGTVAPMDRAQRIDIAIAIPILALGVLEGLVREHTDRWLVAAAVTGVAV